MYKNKLIQPQRKSRSSYKKTCKYEVLFFKSWKLKFQLTLSYIKLKEEETKGSFVVTETWIRKRVAKSVQIKLCTLFYSYSSQPSTRNF